MRRLPVYVTLCYACAVLVRVLVNPLNRWPFLFASILSLFRAGAAKRRGEEEGKGEQEQRVEEQSRRVPSGEVS